VQQQSRIYMNKKILAENDRIAAGNGPRLDT
jgi:hypothetical protein